MDAQGARRVGPVAMAAEEHLQSVDQVPVAALVVGQQRPQCLPDVLAQLTIGDFTEQAVDTEF